jgi:hypothetical protein
MASATGTQTPTPTGAQTPGAATSAHIPTGDAMVATMQILPDRFADTMAQNMAQQQKKYITKEPHEFDGDHRKYEAWRTAIELHADETKGNGAKIKMALSYMTKGPAAVWANLYRQGKRTDINNDQITWDEFIQGLDHTYRPLHHEATSLEEMLALCMDHNEMAENFFNRYLKKAQDANRVRPDHNSLHVQHLGETLPRELRDALNKDLVEERRIFAIWAKIQHNDPIL